MFTSFVLYTVHRHTHQCRATHNYINCELTEKFNASDGSTDCVRKKFPATHDATKTLSERNADTVELHCVSFEWNVFKQRKIKKKLKCVSLIDSRTHKSHSADVIHTQTSAERERGSETQTKRNDRENDRTKKTEGENDRAREREGNPHSERTRKQKACGKRSKRCTVA